MAKSTPLPNLEASLTEISQLVEHMERGDLELEKSLQQFERGITLIRHAQKTLQHAEQRVKILLEKNGSEKLSDYGADDDTD